MAVTVSVDRPVVQVTTAVPGVSVGAPAVPVVAVIVSRPEVGVSTDRPTVETIAPSVAIPRLTLRLVIDFNGLPSQNLLTGGDGTKTFAGFTWTAFNTAAASTMAIVNGVGLVIACNTVDSDFDRPLTATAPFLQFNSIQLFTPTEFQNHVWLAKAALDHNADAATELAGVGWRVNGSPVFNWAIGIGRSASSDIMRNIRDVGTFTVNRSAPDRIVAISAGSQGKSCRRKLSAQATALGEALPSFADLDEERQCAINVVATPTLGSNRLLNLFAASGNTDGNFVATFRRLELYALDGGVFP